MYKLVNLSVLLTSALRKEHSPQDTRNAATSTEVNASSPTTTRQYRRNPCSA
jgi:hypothetical protein